MVGTWKPARWDPHGQLAAQNKNISPTPLSPGPTYGGFLRTPIFLMRETDSWSPVSESMPRSDGLLPNPELDSLAEFFANLELRIPSINYCYLFKNVDPQILKLQQLVKCSVGSLLFWRCHLANFQNKIPFFHLRFCFTRHASKKRKRWIALCFSPPTNYNPTEEFPYFPSHKILWSSEL